MSKVAGGIVGTVTGLIIGPFAAVGKWFSLLEEETIIEQHDYEDPYFPNPIAVLLGMAVFSAAGLIYGPIRGAYLGVNEGLHTNTVKNVAKEMFTYDFRDSSRLDTWVRRDYPQGLTFTSYRTLRQRNIVTTLHKNQEVTVNRKTEPVELKTITFEQSDLREYGTYQSPTFARMS